MLTVPVGTRPQRIANGPDVVRAADALRREVKRRDRWPYVHVYPPPNSERRDPMGYIAAPATGTGNQAVVLAFTVPEGFVFFLQQLGLFYQGENTLGFGSFVFTVDKNTAIGSPGFASSPISDWQSIGFPLGSPQNGPVTLPRAEIFLGSDLIQAKVVNNSVTPGFPNSFGAWFGGYLVPSVEYPNAQ